MVASEMQEQRDIFAEGMVPGLWVLVQVEELVLD
jgi:hypothetical protein